MSRTSTRSAVRRRAWERAIACLLGGAACGGDGEVPPAGSTAGTAAGSSTVSASAASTGSTATSSPPTGSVDDDTGAPTEGWTPSLDVDRDVGAFFSVWGSSEQSVYAVAAQPLDGGLSRGAIQRWDGARWSSRELPDDTPALHWVFGVGARRFVVGDLGVILVRDGDEGEWTRHGCETVLPLWGVWAAAPDDAWAVGGDGFNRDPVACHFDGEAWTRWTLPGLSVESHALYKVWGTASDDVWAVGDRGVILRWRGEAEGWTEAPSGTEFDLIALWGTGPDDILAVGGRTTGVLSRWDGRAWTAREVPELPGLNGVWMDPDGHAVVVGPQGGAGRVEAGTLAVARDDGGTALALHGVFGFSGGERWAVGGSLDLAPPYVGVIVRWIP